MRTITVTPELLYDVAAAISTQLPPAELLWQDDEAEALALEADMLFAEGDRLYDELVPPQHYAGEAPREDKPRTWQDFATITHLTY